MSQITRVPKWKGLTYAYAFLKISVRTRAYAAALVVYTYAKNISSLLYSTSIIAHLVEKIYTRITSIARGRMFYESDILVIVAMVDHIGSMYRRFRLPFFLS